MRKLAGTFIEGVLPRLGIKIGSDHALWAWAARHARWVLNRFRPVEGATPYELVYGKSFKGLLAEYGEPVHGYIKSLNKGGARWRVCLFLGKVERQDQDGVQVALSKCIRRTDQDWSKYMPVYKSFNAFSGEYQTNFGGRIIATKRRAVALPAAQTDIPREHVTLKFRDEDTGNNHLNEEVIQRKKNHYSQSQWRFQPHWKSNEERWR